MVCEEMGTLPRDRVFPLRDEYYSDELKALEADLAPYCRDGILTGRSKKTIHYRVYTHPKPKGAMVICHDGGESLSRYPEWAGFYHEMGFAVYLLDFCGHGGSRRTVANRSVTHVDSFRDYAADLADLTSRIDRKLPLHITAFGMGGAVALLYMQNNPRRVTSAALIAPLIGIELPEPHGLYRWRLKRKLRRGMSEELLPDSSCYQPGEVYSGSGWYSFARFSWYRRLRALDTRLQNSAYTHGWLAAALDASDAILSSKSNKIAARVLFVEAGQDAVVPQKLYGRLQKQMPGAGHVCLSEAEHRIQNGDGKTLTDLLALMSVFFQSH